MGGEADLEDSHREVPMDWEWYYPESGEEWGEPVRRTWANLLSNKIPLSALDRDELVRMQMRDRNGNFSGPKPLRLPREMHRERARLLSELAEESDLAFMMKAVEHRQQLVEDPNADAALRLKAAIYAEERARGKVAERVEMTAEIKPWEGLVRGILVDVQEDSAAIVPE